MRAVGMAFRHNPLLCGLLQLEFITPLHCEPSACFPVINELFPLSHRTAPILEGHAERRCDTPAHPPNPLCGNGTEGLALRGGGQTHGFRYPCLLLTTTPPTCLCADVCPTPPPKFPLIPLCVAPPPPPYHKLRITPHRPPHLPLGVSKSSVSMNVWGADGGVEGLWHLCIAPCSPGEGGKDGHSYSDRGLIAITARPRNFKPIPSTLSQLIYWSETEVWLLKGESLCERGPAGSQKSSGSPPPPPNSQTHVLPRQLRLVDAQSQHLLILTKHKLQRERERKPACLPVLSLSVLRKVVRRDETGTLPTSIMFRPKQGPMKLQASLRPQSCNEYTSQSLARHSLEAVTTAAHCWHQPLSPYPYKAQDPRSIFVKTGLYNNVAPGPLRHLATNPT
ncbi:hypothetical protein JZ751_007373 [Albula glossodonta]|uniref:Uncharacterized protein n=1 Tax=Albula glossodonta TaxID=121402 RepID=A0A8T2N403_9TELE|nr:hypothetical protein JZ751_007373 [Albula glossodonta]